MKLNLLHVFAVCLMVGASAYAYVYEHDFDTGTDGWEALSDSASSQWMSTGGLADSGYLRGTRSTYTALMQPHHPGASDALTGNVTARFGSMIRFTYFGRVFSGGNVSFRHSVIGAGPTYGAYWTYTFASDSSAFVNQWGPVSFEVDTTWTDAEAMANGWVNYHDSTSFADSWKTVQFQQFFSGNGYAGSTNITGFDQVRVESLAAIPAPLGVLAGGAALLMIRHRGTSN